MVNLRNSVKAPWVSSLSTRTMRPVGMATDEPNGFIVAVAFEYRDSNSPLTTYPRIH